MPTNAQGAVMATRPARVPLRIMLRSGLPSAIQATSVAARQPAAAAMLVFSATRPIAFTSTAIVLPGLNPNQPSQRMNVPSVAKPMLWAGIGFTLPFLYLPMRGPRISTPVSAAQPPMLCTTVEPAKSLKPAAPRKPPPQAQWPAIG